MIVGAFQRPCDQACDEARSSCAEQPQPPEDDKTPLPAAIVARRADEAQKDLSRNVANLREAVQHLADAFVAMGKPPMKGQRRRGSGTSKRKSSITRSKGAKTKLALRRNASTVVRKAMRPRRAARTGRR